MDLILNRCFPWTSALAAILGILILSGCSGQLEAGDLDMTAAPPQRDSSVNPGRKDGSVIKPKKDGSQPPPKKDGSIPPPGPDSSVPPPKLTSYSPCKVGKCWNAPTLSNLCGATSINEDYSSGKYNVHKYALSPQPGVKVEVTLNRTAGSWNSALIIHNAKGVTVYDGVTSFSSASLTVQALSSGKGSNVAKARITAHKATPLILHATGWGIVQSGFSFALPTTAKYKLTVSSGCAPPKPGKLLSPPNFDAKNKVKGYYLLPPSQPSGLYTRKADPCARGTKLLIDVLYTVAVHWKQKWPSLSPISILDLNEGSCSTVNHATHDDGTHVDLTAGCATQVSCTNNQPAIDLAKLFVDTGQVCGIINNDPAVQAVVNSYFKKKFSYKPWHGTFMRSVSGHTHHFHVRVKKPNGSCN